MSMQMYLTGMWGYLRKEEGTFALTQALTIMTSPQFNFVASFLLQLIYNPHILAICFSTTISLSRNNKL